MQRILILMCVVTVSACSNEFVNVDAASLPCTADTDCAEGRVCQGALCLYEEEAPLPIYAIWIKDRSEGGACDTISPGADLFAVVATTGSGTILALGEPAPARGFEFSGTGHNEFMGVQGWNQGFETSGTRYLDTTCPEFTPDNVISLGCGGSVLMTFSDAPWLVGEAFKDRVPLTEQHTVHVYEYGSQCATDSPPVYHEWADAYEVRLCPKTVFGPYDDGSEFNPDDCYAPNALYTGHSAFDVRPP